MTSLIFLQSSVQLFTNYRSGKCRHYKYIIFRAGIYLFKVNNRNTVNFMVNLEHVSHLILAFFSISICYFEHVIAGRVKNVCSKHQTEVYQSHVSCITDMTTWFYTFQ